MPFPVPNKANKTPISTILRWYLERKKGKVVESRQEIQRRFGGLDWAIQKKIILAFLSSGKADRTWAYEQLIWYWDNDFLPKTKELFEQYHEKKIFWPVIWYFPTDYIIDHLDELAVDFKDSIALFESFKCSGFKRLSSFINVSCSALATAAFALSRDSND